LFDVMKLSIKTLVETLIDRIHAFNCFTTFDYTVFEKKTYIATVDD